MPSRRRACLLLLLAGVLAGATPAPSKDGRAETAPPQGGKEEPAAEPRLQVVRQSKQAFGTDVSMMAVATSEAEARVFAAQLDAAFAELLRVASLTDGARETSDIARVNRAAGGEPVVVAPEVFDLLQEAKRVAALSRGAFDPTLAPVAEAWRFLPSDGEEAPKPPSDEELAARRALVSHEDLVLDEAARTAALKRPTQKLGLEAIARGYALERAARLLEERGVQNFVIAAGGDLVVRGAHGDRSWRVGIQDPRAPGHFAATPVKGGAVMTTGDYERFFEEGWERYHDVLDARTGKPAKGARSVTIFAQDAATADALSTAVFVLGAKRGLALVERLKGVEAVIVTESNRVLVTKGLKKELTWRPPTDAP